LGACERKACGSSRADGEIVRLQNVSGRDRDLRTDSRRDGLYARVRHSVVLSPGETIANLVVGFCVSGRFDRDRRSRGALNPISMHEVLKDLERWRTEGESVALATLVGVQGSAPRSVGSRMAMTAGGRMAGSVSGGCVESDVMDRAIHVLDSGDAELLDYDIVSDDELVGIGLHCGSVKILIQPYLGQPAWNALSRALEQEIPAVLVTSLSTDSTAAEAATLGRQMTITEHDSTGSIRPDSDAEICTQARRVLPGGRTATVALDVGGDKALELFVESFQPRPRLFVVGATHIAVALCRMAVNVGFHVTVVDPRKIFANEDRFPDADRLCLEWPEIALGGDVLGTDSYLVAVSHDSKFDVPALVAALRAKVRYIGALGSRATHARRREKLRALGFEDEALDRIHAPIGLDIGAEGAEEIAVSILAELLAVRRGHLDARDCRGVKHDAA
jgi:xanthine dehydrogenase accessory factor